MAGFSVFVDLKLVGIKIIRMTFSNDAACMKLSYFGNIMH
jgi:hypothetical protein